MKKILSISVIGFLLFASCMVYNPDYSDALESTPTTKKAKSQTEEIEPAKEKEPETEIPPVAENPPVIEEPAEEPETEVPVVPTEPVEEEPEEKPTEEPTPVAEPADPVAEDPVIEEPSEPEEPKPVNWKKFYTRLEKKAREKYNKLPWNDLAKDAHVPLASWMTSASCCVASPPSEDVIRKIADVLEVSYEWLLYGDA